MSENRSDPSEPIWDLEDFLGEDAADIKEEEEKRKQEASSSSSEFGSDASGPQYEVDELLEEERTGTTGDGQERSTGFFPSGQSVVLFFLIIAAPSVYLAGTYGGNTTDVHSRQSVRPLTMSDIRTWIEQGKDLVALLSDGGVTIHSSSLLGFSTEMRNRPKLEQSVSHELSTAEFRSFRLTTRDIGNAMRLINAGPGPSGTEESTSSTIHKNAQLVKEHREEISAVWQRLRQLNASPSQPSPPSSNLPADRKPSPSGTGSQGIK